ncbi:hypothetical protein [Tomitella biformata]|nr:hypothetical protein [Tomitella biformata]
MLAVPQIAMAAPPATYDISGTFTNDCGGGGGAWIELKDSTNTPIDSQFIDGGDPFTFTGVADGDYTVVPYAPAGCGVTPYPGGAPVTVDGADATADVGLVSVYSIWGVVTGCEAGDGNGVNGVAVAVDIDTADLKYHAETQTSAITEDGQFFFQYLPAFDGYQVTVTPPAGCVIAVPTVGVNLTNADVDDVAFALETAPNTGSLASLDMFGSLGSLGFLGSSGSTGS